MHTILEIEHPDKRIEELFGVLRPTLGWYFCVKLSDRDALHGFTKTMHGEEHYFSFHGIWRIDQADFYNCPADKVRLIGLKLTYEQINKILNDDNSKLTKQEDSEEASLFKGNKR